MSAVFPKTGTAYDILSVPELSLAMTSRNGSSPYLAYVSPTEASASFPESSTPKNMRIVRKPLRSPGMFDLEEDEDETLLPTLTPAPRAPSAIATTNVRVHGSHTSEPHSRTSWLAGGSASVVRPDSLSTGLRSRSFRHLSANHNHPPSHSPQLGLKPVAKQLSFVDCTSRYSPVSSSTGSSQTLSNHSWPGTGGLS
jgi:hypothetical protein